MTTDADRAKAADLWNRSQADYRGIDRIAAALAAAYERGFEEARRTLRRVPCRCGTDFCVCAIHG